MVTRREGEELDAVSAGRCTTGFRLGEVDAPLATEAPLAWPAFGNVTRAAHGRILMA